ncbi:TetR/AcrR family transcriptional regulator [Sphingosinicella sp. BN140058]|nr:TetR/AcrR family transcriptional regulator [Sphingosinicella sp. BN140058]
MVARNQTVECGSGCGEPKKNAAARIFETARDLFYRRGIRAVGVDEIVCSAGVTKPSLYRSYASKDDLVAACLVSYADESRASIDARLEAAGPEPLARLHALIDHYAAQTSDPDFRGCPMTNTAVEFPEADNPGRGIAETCKSEVRERILGLARQIDTKEPESLTDGLVLLIEGAFSTHHIFGSQGPSICLRKAAYRLIESYRKS